MKHLNLSYSHVGVYLCSQEDIYQWFLMSPVNSKIEIINTASIEDFLLLGFRDLYLSSCKENLSCIHNLVLYEHGHESLTQEECQRILNQEAQNGLDIIFEYTKVNYVMSRENYYQGYSMISRAHDGEELEIYQKALAVVETYKNLYHVAGFLEKLAEDGVADIEELVRIVNVFLPERKIEITGSVYFTPLKVSGLDNTEYIKGLIVRENTRHDVQ